jgi:hypothetical protein
MWETSEDGPKFMATKRFRKHSSSQHFSLVVSTFVYKFLFTLQNPLGAHINFLEIYDK